MKNTRMYLLSRGWKKLNSKPYQNRVIFWAHPEHQSDDGRFFTTASALDHQRNYDREGKCKCTKQS